MWTLPDKGEGASNNQSVLFQEYLDVLLAGIAGVDCVLSGCAVTAQGSPDMTCAVAKGAVLSNGVLLPVTAGNVTITAADGTNPRIDLVVVNSSGTKAVRAGTPAAFPAPPARTANDVVIATVYVPTSDTTIATNQITDLRVMCSQGPVVLKKTTSPVSFNTTSGIQTYATLTVPNGLFLSGKVIRCRMGGSFLLNNSTPTLTLTIKYGATTLFADVSIAGAADADRGAWSLQFDLIAQANNDQALVGLVNFSPTIAQRIAPTTGVAGDLLLSATAANNPHTTSIVGSAAIDSDAANSDLLVQWTMSVSNINDEIVAEYSTFELL